MTAFSTAKAIDHGFAQDRLDRIAPFFSSYLEQQRLPNVGIVIMRNGHIVYEHFAGKSAFDGGFTPDKDSLYRIYSMTKPITSVGLMMLYEQGKCQLYDPVSKFIPAFKKMDVFVSGTPNDYQVRPADREITIHDLLTHQSGLTYDFMMESPVDALYRNHKINGARSEKQTLEELCEKITELPLLFSPGERWNYSVATDICGRLIEIISGKSLDQYFEEEILKPLKMNNTMFTLEGDNLKRLTHNYARDPISGKTQLADSPDKTVYRTGRRFLSGGGGLLSTMNDYLRFTEFLRLGGQLDGVRLLSPLTLSMMTSNHLPNNETLITRANGAFSEVSSAGTGFGLGFSVVTNPTEAATVSSMGTYAWGGLASTFFWNDPVYDMNVVFFTQLMPSRTYPLGMQLRQLVYSAIIS